MWLNSSFLIETDAHEKARLLDTFLNELAVGPVELEEMLRCSRVERRRWIEEGKIPVLEHRQFQKAGHDLLYPVHDRRVILNLSQEEIAQWRAVHHTQIQAKRKDSAYIAAEHRKANQRVRQNFQVSWQQTVEEWTQCGSPELAAVFRLSYWTVWASRWAKENHVRSLRSTKNSALYSTRRDAWYERKNEAMSVLVQTSYAHLSFYRPVDADKRYLWLCEEHYDMKREEYYTNIWDFFDNNVSAIKKCSRCILSEEKDYYALYYLNVKDVAFPDMRFSFHMPYPLGKTLFPAPRKLPKVEHEEQDGIFRFGRPLFAYEKITHREQDVLAHLEQALQEMKTFPALTKQDKPVRESHLSVIDQ